MVVERSLATRFGNHEAKRAFFSPPLVGAFPFEKLDGRLEVVPAPRARLVVLERTAASANAFSNHEVVDMTAGSLFRTHGRPGQGQVRALDRLMDGEPVLVSASILATVAAGSSSRGIHR